MSRPPLSKSLRQSGLHQPRRSAQRRWLAFECLEERTLPTFVGPPAYAFGNAQFSDDGKDVLAADFTGDGHLDLAVPASGIKVFVGNGDGTFQSPVNTSGTNPNAFAAADFNEDGKRDLVVLEYQTARVALSNGDGSFTDAGVILTGDNLMTLVVGDLNGDGHQDIVIDWNDQPTAEGTPNFVAVILGDGNGGFAPAVNYFVSEGGGGFVAVGDFNEDGHQDVAAVYFMLLGYGDGTLQAPQETGVFGEIVADFNNDNHLDLLSTGSFLSLGNGDGTFQAGSWQGAWDALAATDVDHDGNVDLLATNYQSTGGFALLRGLGDGTFASPRYHRITNNVLALAAGDFNGDGYDDLVETTPYYPWHSAFQNSALVYLNDQQWTNPAPAITITDATLTEGNTGSQTASFTVNLSFASTQTVTVDFATGNATSTFLGYGAATAGSDYVATSGTLTFAPGQTSKVVSVSVIGDRNPEANEIFFVDLGYVTNATITDARGHGTILDNEPRITIGDVSKAEGKNGNTAFIFTVFLSVAYDQVVTVSYQTENGTAQTGSDYVAKNGTLTFSPGQTSKTITVNVKGDKVVEGNETFFVRLFGASTNALIVDDLALALILNDD